MSNRFAEQFPEIYQAEKKAEELAQKAEQEANLFMQELNEAIQAGASKEEINEIYNEIDKNWMNLNLEVIKAIEEVAVAQIKTQVIEIGANEKFFSRGSKEITKESEDLVKEEAKKKN